MAEGTFRPVPIRNAVEADVEEIHALIGELATYERAADEFVATVDDLRHQLFDPSPAASVLIAETDDGEIAGFALYYPTFSTWLGRPGIWLEDLFVRPEHRKRGFGLALLQELRSRTDDRVEWAVLDWNEPSIRFYEALGARPVDGWTRYRWLRE
jgi:GNAT superfamily N-acetyltransferase